ncbi:MAG: tRNA (adenosine(37)-N6)-threonylcarbamoyltransferase complex transferase subunit TsaD [Deltaproteobacteria bacterium]|nr:tRNA (adenosine(37)-N6)-threonylcarbamoyltransferase complex transferase subunit TsaD [Deltaproteobacteria bacterium]
MFVLGIETSCDETAAAVVEDGRIVRSDVVASQILVHAEYGGVVPEVASRQHVATIVPVIRRALEEAQIGWTDVDGIAVTRGPGLVGALLVGVETAKALGYALDRPVIGVNHLAGHLAAVFLEDATLPVAPPPYPHLALLVSGGHTALIRVAGSGSHQLLGATRDDAAGEAFDKVGKMLGLGYPGGVQIDRLAAKGRRDAFALPRALPARDDIDFSFSGLKTAVSTLLSRRTTALEGDELADMAASVQAAIVDVLVRKTRKALSREGLRHLVVCGGVAANRGLRQAMAAAAAEDGFTLYIPPAKRCTDNASMIAAAGTQLLARGERSPVDLAVDPGLPL